MTIEDVKYLLSSHFQGTPYDPYDRVSPLHGKYRSIGVPNSDDSGILQIRGYLPEEIRAVEWISLGGSGFTSCFPFYTNVKTLPANLSGTTDQHRSSVLAQPADRGSDRRAVLQCGHSG